MINKKRILIVDDVSSNIHLLMSILKQKYSIVAATSGEKALQLAKTSPMPDLILMDIVMPEMDGYEVCNRLKNDETTSHIPIIFITSLNSITEQEKSLKCGAADFITKPFSKDIVLHKVETHLNMQNLRNTFISDFMKIDKERSMNDEKQSILVVDDSPENIQVIIEVLKYDYTVSVATSAKKSLEVLENGLMPDLILLDVIMPEMDGYEFCKILKNNDKYRSIPIIFVTILENEKDIVKGFELGAVDYAIKPIEPTVLKARVKTHLKLKRFQDSLLEDIKIKKELIYHQSKLATLGEIFENITHQWKQPLSTISVATSGIKIHSEYNDLDVDTLNNSLETIDLSVEYLSKTIDDFKGFLLNDNSKYTFNIKEIIEKAIKLLSAKLKDNFIILQTSLDDIMVNNYQNDLVQVLMNILSNAIDALTVADGDKKISIEVFSNDEKEFTIVIKDNAGRIDSQNLDKIFDKYFTIEKNKVGSGIGLFMSKKIIQERLKGDIKVQDIDNGTCFEITLPKDVG